MDTKDKLAFAHVLKYVLCGMRSHAKDLSPEQIYDIMDAVHNIPDVFSDNTWVKSNEYLKTYFEAYDSKWSGKPNDVLGISLRDEYNSIIKAIA